MEIIPVTGVHSHAGKKFFNNGNMLKKSTENRGYFIQLTTVNFLLDKEKILF